MLKNYYIFVKIIINCVMKCIVKIKRKNNGQHKDCNVRLIEDIEEEKKSKLKGNIKIFEDLSIIFKQLIEDLKI